MSADNWTQCPKCAEAAKKHFESEQRKVADAYGKVTPEDYANLCDELRNLGKSEATDSLREDWDLGLTKGNEFYVSYMCSCNECGFEFRYRHAEQVYPEK